MRRHEERIERKKKIMSELPAPDLAKFRAAVQRRELAVRAALEHYRRVELPPSQQYARATYDAIEEILIQTGRKAAAAEAAAKLREMAAAPVNVGPDEIYNRGRRAGYLEASGVVTEINGGEQ